MMNKIQAKELLHDILNNGVAVDIFQAEQSLCLINLILKNSKEINESTFVILFRTLQFILTKEFTLSITKLYEKSDRRYSNRSIPSALKLLNQHAGELVIGERYFIIKKLAKYGFDGKYLDGLNDTQITEEIAKYFQNVLLTKLSNGMLSKALSALMTARDKVIAHSEAIQTLDLPKTTLEEAEQLLVFAKKFLGVVGMGYLSIAYEDSDGNHFLSQDAKRVSRAMERLLIKAGIIKQDKPSIP